MKGQIVSATLYDVITLLLRSVGDSGRMKKPDSGNAGSDLRRDDSSK